MKRFIVLVILMGIGVCSKAQSVDTVIKSKADTAILIAVEKQPEFPGGIEGLMNYLQKNLKYPKDELNNKVQGKVRVQFVVEKDGSLTDITVIKSVSAALDEEAVRVMKASPKWQPGMALGKPCRVRYSIPINFALNR